MVSKMNIGKGRAKANIEKLAGTHRQVGKNLRDMELGGHEATLYKIDTTRFYNNGWICVLKDTGEEVEAFNTFEPYERVLPLGELGQGVINFTPPVEVLLLQDRNGDEWHIIRSLDKKDIVVEPGEKVFQNGQSRFSIKEGIVELTTPKFVLDADIIEGIEISGSEGPPGPEGKGYFGLTSLSSITIGTGSKTFTVNQAQGTNAFAVGDQIRIKYNTSNYMDGIVTSYSGTSFVANISNYVGSGTYATWTIGITGTKGNDGAEGPQGPQGEPASQENIDDRITTLVWDYYPAFVDDRITAADIPSMIQTAINNAENAIFDEFVVSEQAGRITFGNGFMVEWGYHVFEAATGTRTQAVTFTNTFAYAPSLTTSANIGASGYVNKGALSLGGSGFTLFLNTELNVGGTVRWLAIGKRSGY
jgi:hypothetical protein